MFNLFWRALGMKRFRRRNGTSNVRRGRRRRRVSEVSDTRALFKESLKFEVETCRHLLYQAETESKIIAQAYELEIQRNKNNGRSYVV
jgi:hypothetical protein